MYGKAYRHIIKIFVIMDLLVTSPIKKSCQGCVKKGISILGARSKWRIVAIANWRPAKLETGEEDSKVDEDIALGHIYRLDHMKRAFEYTVPNW